MLFTPLVPQEFAELSESEQGLISVLQVNPRVSWVVAAGALGIDPTTISRIWRGLVESGRAWISAYPRATESGPPLIAFIEISCGAGSVDAVAASVVDRPWAATVERTTGRRDLLVSGMVRDLEALTALLTQELEMIDGVVSTRIQVATVITVEGSGWRLGALSAEAIRRVTDDRPLSYPRSTRIDRRDRVLMDLLGVDGRVGYSEAAAATGLGITTVRRRIQRLISTGAVGLRCEVAQPLSGRPVAATLWCRVAPSDMNQVMSGLSAMPEVRLCASTTGGPTNLLLALWLRSPGDLQRLEEQLSERVSALEVVDRALVLRHYKRMGRLLGDAGRAVGVIPVSAN
ncbi:Lrp/AsnC family transcriptional regulator [Tsukamurella tyrosinosolvens]|uniref:Lrp/AsnC family transcriptional regulator n=1 Tax=Tsukamurella tyrosinosolvens TaxID=57704 RepID=UPI00159EDE34|nr:Lrp/AsnC family transcriptional regulator [Tsukamurella tyrosinosolvens]